MDDDASYRYMKQMSSLEQLFPLGKLWSYNNSGFYLAGHVLEQVTGKTYQELLSELVFRPLELHSSYLDPNELEGLSLSSGHLISEDNRVVKPWRFPKALYPAGGIKSDIRDLMRFAEFHLGNGEDRNGNQVLSSQSLAEMQTSQVRISKERQAGLGWEIDSSWGIRVLSHNGATSGQVSQLVLIPDHGLALGILTNADSGRALISDLLHWFFEESLKVVVPDSVPLKDYNVSEYVGMYCRPFADAHLYLEDDTLMVQVIPKKGFPSMDSSVPAKPDPITLAVCDHDVLFVTEGPLKNTKFDLIRKDDGSIGWFRMGRVYVRDS